MRVREGVIETWHCCRPVQEPVNVTKPYQTVTPLLLLSKPSVIRFLGHCCLGIFNVLQSLVYFTLNLNCNYIPLFFTTALLSEEMMCP